MKAYPASQYNPGWNLAIDLNNMIVICEAVAKAALNRKESRGAHTRLDYPEEKEECITFNSIIKKNKIATVLHFAALKSVEESIINQKLYYENNVVGTFKLLNAVAKMNVKKVILVQAQLYMIREINLHLVRETGCIQ